MNVTLTLMCSLSISTVNKIMRVQNFSLISMPLSKKSCPDSDIVKEITFNLYTRNNINEPQQLSLHNLGSIKSSHVDFTNPTVIYFHGFTESSKTADSQLIKNSLLQRKSYNVILVDAERLLAGLYYSEAVDNTRVIGKHAALFVDFLIDNGMKLRDLHVIGFSLGAHISGFVGQYIKRGKLPRITGLDPAGPRFNGLHSSDRLDPTDAQFVDVIHSSKGTFGYKSSCGHVDFWINGGGPFQPGCSLIERSKSGSLNEFVFCDHYRSYRLYARSIINPNRYTGMKCPQDEMISRDYCQSENTEIFGFAVNIRAKGNYYLDVGLEGQNDDLE